MAEEARSIQMGIRAGGPVTGTGVSNSRSAGGCCNARYWG